MNDTAKKLMTTMSTNDLVECVEDIMGLNNKGTMPLDCMARRLIAHLVDEGVAQPGTALFVGQTLILQEAARRWLDLVKKGQ